MNTFQDELAETAPSRPSAALSAFQPIRILKNKQEQKIHKRQFGCLWFFALFGFILVVYFFAPLRTNILILGVDGGLGRGDLGRTDTIILASISPLKPLVGILSIPRDLWVPQMDGSENRINTSFFFAEAQRRGSGAEVSRQVVAKNFGVPVLYSIVLRMDGVVDIIDTLGGVEVILDEPISGYAAGIYLLDGGQALSFARNRSGSDDFSRMTQGQILLKGIFRQLLKPASWSRLPAFFEAVQAATQVDIPVWQWPRLGLAVLRAGPTGIDARSISREMVIPFTTNQGAQVLGPNWDAINPMLEEFFGK